MLHHARALIAEGGVDEVTIKALAGRMGASVGGLYRYYPSKGDILVALQRDAIAGYEGWLDEHLSLARRWLADALEPRTLFAVVLIGFSSYLEHARRDPDRHRLIEVFLSSPRAVLSDEHAREVEQQIHPLLGKLARLLDACVDREVLRPGDGLQRTHVIWACLHGLDQFRKRDRIQPPSLQVDVLAGESLATLLMGWGAVRPDVDAAMALRRQFWQQHP